MYDIYTFLFDYCIGLYTHTNNCRSKYKEKEKK